MSLTQGYLFVFDKEGSKIAEKLHVESTFELEHGHLPPQRLCTNVPCVRRAGVRARGRDRRVFARAQWPATVRQMKRDSHRRPSEERQARPSSPSID